MPSVNKFTPTTSEATAAAGASGTHGARVRIERLSEIIAPQSGEGGSTPRPRNPNDDARRIAYENRTEPSTASTGNAFGRISLKFC